VGRSLEAGQIDDFQRDGLLSPIRVLDGIACASYRHHFATLAAAVGPGRADAAWMTNLHLHLGWCYDLVTWSPVLDVVQDLIGPDILVLSSIFFVKEPGLGRFVSWHQDSRYFRRNGRPLRALTAWIALAPSTRQNGCLVALPGSHTQGYVPHDLTYDGLNMLRRGDTARAPIDESRAVAMPLETGEISIHHIDTLHASGVNEGTSARIGLAVRYIVPDTALTIDHAPVLLARGADTAGHHGRCDARPSDDLDTGLASLADAVARSALAGTAEPPGR
jgi:phytanoyl-CoA dioxygenase PhyH